MRLISNTSQRLTTFFILMISFSLIAKSSSFLRKSAFIISPYARNHSLRSRLFSSSLSDSIGTSSKHVEYLKTIANAEPPKKLETFFELLQLTDYEIIEPTERKGLIPLVIPIAKKRMAEYPVLCFMRWPTQKQGIDLQIAQTNAIGVQLIALNTENYCKRIVAELDFYGDANASKAIEIINKDGIVYTEGECLAILKSGKFPTISDKDLRLALDRYLLTVVGQFPDCYERLADNFASNENEISALVTCERAVNLFYGWGHPVRFHAEILNRMVGRETEARDAARSAMGLPVWTIAPTKIVRMLLEFIL